MLPIADSLVSRLLTIALGGFCAFTLLVALILFRPSHGQPGVSPFELPLPQETAAIVQAIEASPPETRPLVVEALNSSVTAVRLENDFPPIPAGLQRKPILERRFAAYETLLGDRAIRVELAPRASLSFLGLGPTNGSTPPVRMMVALKTGQVLVIEHRPPAIVRSYVGRIMAILAAATLVILIGLGVAVRRTTSPVRRLALSARRFSFDLAAPDLPVSGPREIRDLSSAFNDMQRRIRDLVAERTRLLAAIAHDLRTYLTRLRLRADFIDDVDQRRRAEQDIADMSKLLDDTLLFAQHTTARCATDEICDAGHEVTILVEQRLEIGEPVSLISLPQWPIPIACARTSLHRMVNNLIDNAIRYGTCARLGIWLSLEAVEIAVEDDGEGVPSQALEDLTKPFVRLEASRGRETGGAGLGLAIVKGMVEGCGGTLHVGNLPGGGLRAVLTFPLAKLTADLRTAQA